MGIRNSNPPQQSLGSDLVDDGSCDPHLQVEDEMFPDPQSLSSVPAMATTFTEVWKPAAPPQKSAGPTTRLAEGGEPHGT